MDGFLQCQGGKQPIWAIPPIGSGGLVWDLKAFRIFFWNDSNVPRPVCSGGFKMFVGVSTTVITLKPLCVC